jgi:hypothetical protein
VSALRLLSIACMLVGCSSSEGAAVPSVSCPLVSFAGTSSCDLALEQCSDGRKYQAHCDGTTCTCDPGGATFAQGNICTAEPTNRKSTVVSGCGWSVK